LKPSRRRRLDPVHGFLGLQLLSPGFGEALDAGDQAALDAVLPKHLRKCQAMPTFFGLGDYGCLVLARLGVASLTVGAHGPPAPPALRDVHRMVVRMLVPY